MQAIINGTMFLLMALRLTFGGKPCPSEWGSLAEPVADLATDILNCPEWDPSELHSPLQSKMPPPVSLHSSIPFGKAKPTIVDIPDEDMGKVDVYLDDKIAIGPDLPGMIPRLSACILLAISVFFRPISPDKPIPRDDAAAPNKLIAEGGLSEVKLILGWLYDTRRLVVSLPPHKFTAWSTDIRTIITNTFATYAELDTLIGRLNHAAYVIPAARHFLSRIRHLKSKAKYKRKINIPTAVSSDLNLWISF